MLLETLDIKKDDIIVYSQNLFDLEKNFKVIYKDDPQKNPRKITYNEVCRFLNEYTPKNLIVYRMLTNIRDFQISLSKYGYFVNINGISELIYFDPIFAVKELEDYPEAINYYDLRFRIQQVGLTTLNRMGDLPNFAEIYNIDLIATEAKFQNDKVFADAILLYYKADKNQSLKIENVDNLHEESPVFQELETKQTKAEVAKKEGTAKVNEQSVSNIIKPHENIKHKIDTKEGLPYKVKPDKEHFNGIKIIKHDISEDDDFDYKQIMKVGGKKSNNEKIANKTSISKKLTPAPLPAENNGVPKLITHEMKKKSAFGKFLEDSKTSNKKGSKLNQSEVDEKNSLLIDIFKSSVSFDKYVHDRKDKQIVLKLNKK